jgi:secreted trypsin-like serine protease
MQRCETSLADVQTCENPLREQMYKKSLRQIVNIHVKTTHRQACKKGGKIPLRRKSTKKWANTLVTQTVPCSNIQLYVNII